MYSRILYNTRHKFCVRVRVIVLIQSVNCTSIVLNIRLVDDSEIDELHWLFPLNGVVLPAGADLPRSASLAAAS